MPTTSTWLASDRRGDLGLFSLERWGMVPDDAALLWEGARGDEVWRALHVAWIADMAPLSVVFMHTLVTIPEAEGPHLVAFRERREDLPGAHFITDTVARFERIGAELGERLAEDEGVLGSISLDQASFGDFVGAAVYRYSRWGDDAVYRRAGAPQAAMKRSSLPEHLEGVAHLDTEFAAQERLDLAAILEPRRSYDAGNRPSPAAPGPATVVSRPWWRRLRGG